jgi:hypothetical protein
VSLRVNGVALDKVWDRLGPKSMSFAGKSVAQYAGPLPMRKIAGKMTKVSSDDGFQQGKIVHNLATERYKLKKGLYDKGDVWDNPDQAVAQKEYKAFHNPKDFCINN